jgi:acetyltransferase-like isoleucine patch superfamily enzyme
LIICKNIKFFLLFFLNSFVSKVPSFFLRHSIYKLSGVKLSKNSSILRNVKILYPSNIFIGEGSIINSNCILDGRGAMLIIGKNVDIAPEVNIWTLQHDINSPVHDVVGSQVQIHDYAWIANRVIILPGVCIAEGTVVAAGSVVTSNTQPYSLYAGVPAKLKKKLNISKKSYSLNYKPPFH